ncbi:MAG TPA: SdpI family protein [Pyrinomonadaceae bacterium]|nr:SdpI family protein [Pyrinomonadaceae bacterium]
MESVFLLYGIGGVLLVAISLPMMYDKVPPNGFYGFRTPRTLSDPNLWYPANRVAGRNLAVAGVIVSTTALVVFAVQKSIQPRTAALTLLIVSMASLSGAVVHSFIALRKM